jgi:hypothetical protein
MTTPSQVHEMLDKLFVACTSDDVGKLLLAIARQGRGSNIHG